MTFRPRFFDLFALAGLVLLLAGTPAYLAQDPTAQDLADGTRFALGSVRLGTVLEQEMIFQHGDADATSLGPVRTAMFRAVRDGEVPVAAAFAYEERWHAVAALFSWGAYETKESERTIWFDASGRPVWVYETRWLEREDGSARLDETAHRWGPMDILLPNNVVGIDVEYHPSAAKRLWTDILEFGKGALPWGRQLDPTQTFVADGVAEHRDQLLFRTGRSGLDEILDRNDAGTCMVCQGVTIDGQAADTVSAEGRHSWYSPAWPLSVGHEVRHDDPETERPVLVQRMMPLSLEEGDGERVRLMAYEEIDQRTRLVDQPVPTVTLAEMATDERPLHRGVAIADLHDILRSSEAPEEVRSFALDAAIVEFYWVAGRPYFGANEATGIGLGSYGDLVPGSVREDTESLPVRWFLTLAKPDGSVRVVMVHIVHGAAGPRVEGIEPACDLKPDTTSFEEHTFPRTSCDPVPPDLVRPDRTVSDPKLLYERIRIDHSRTTGASIDSDLDQYGSLPLFRSAPVEERTGQWTHAAPMHPPAIPGWTWSGGLERYPPFVGRAVAGTTAPGGYSAVYDLDEGGLQRVDLQTEADTRPERTAPVVAAGETRTLDVVAAGAITGGVLLVVVSLLARLFAWLKAGSALPALSAFYAKLAKSDVLLNERREEIMDLVRAEPGIHSREVARSLGYGWGVTMHHLETLVRNGLLIATATSNKRQYFLPEAGDARTRKVLGAQRDPAAAAFLDAVTAEPGITVSRLSARLGRGITGVSRTGSRLARDGLVAKRRDGMTVGFWPSGDP